jgi:hypothetical protein
MTEAPSFPSGWQYPVDNDLRGLAAVRVNKAQTLATLNDNRENHRARFEEAMEGYKQRSIELLEEHIERIRNNDPEQVIVSLPLPEDHTDDYDRVIEQLEWSLDDELELDEQEFNMYIRDQWGWKTSFGQTYAMYTE